MLKKISFGIFILIGFILPSTFANNAGLVFSAIQQGNIQAIEKMIQDGVNIAPKDPQGRTPLMCAIAFGKNEILELLINAGASIDSRDIMNKTALHYAAERNNSRAINILIKAGLDVDTRGFDSPNDGPSESTALHIAAQCKALEAATALINNGADVNALTNVRNGKFRRSPLFWAEKSGDNNMANLLIENGAIKYPEGATDN